jgi:Fe-S cluster assembly iron-binding protein IscA
VLTLTQNASAIVKELIDRLPEADTAGLRLSTDVAEGGVAVTAVGAPEPGDAVVEQGGATVYLEDSASLALTDQVLDAAVDPQGAVQFSLAPQA